VCTAAVQRQWWTETGHLVIRAAHSCARTCKKYQIIFWVCDKYGGPTAVAQWLRYCATNQEVAGSIPDGVMEFFIDINPSDRTMALRSTQPLTEMSTRCISWG
jgi:hypothetical protein